MSKTRRVYTCGDCGAQHLKWQGQCPDCGAWNALAETRDSRRQSRDRAPRTDNAQSARLDQLAVVESRRSSSGFAELDRVLGGGFVNGACVLIGGDPGIGKSTLLLGAAARLSAVRRVCYVTGEESLDQVALRASRLEVADAPVEMLAETCVEAIIEQLSGEPPEVLIVDSVQCLYSEALDSAPGSVSQVRESAGQLVRFAKQRNVTTVLVGHVTKEGTLAGPRVLEHMVDTVLYFETDVGSRYRIIRAVKNRFGAANELGFFVMGEQGFKEVKNPSAIFLAKRAASVSGSVTLATRESSRSLLVEVQALVDPQPGSSRRLAQGFDTQRMNLLLAVAHRHCGIGLGDGDVFANVAGGLKISETAADLAALLAIVSSYLDRALPGDLVVFGEVGLTGEIRPVPFGEERLIEAQKHGFKRAIVPIANKPKTSRLNIDVCGVARLDEAFNAVGFSLAG
jgi:DNA repair protein RadA/Sms